NPRAQSVADKLRANTVTPSTAPPPAANFDDAALAPPLPVLMVPDTHASFGARLDLARMLIDLDLDSALGQYEQLRDAAPALLGKAIDDLSALQRRQPTVARIHTVLEQLQQAMP